jgi:hypothetical protein
LSRLFAPLYLKRRQPAHAAHFVDDATAGNAVAGRYLVAGLHFSGSLNVGIASPRMIAIRFRIERD